jgi:NAD(P)-dependent dehydrogenase (short-subunit alcohol dehydrogenase family)
VKEEIHREYLKDIDRLRTVPEPIQRNVLVVGSDRQSNVGNAVAVQLRNQGAEVSETGEDDTEFYGNPIDGWSQFTDLVLCNGMTHLDWIEDQPPDKIADVIYNCLTASILYVHRFVGETIQNLVRKRIVIVGSMASERVLNASSPYCAAKAGLSHFVDCMAWELTAKGFTVSLVNPGNIKDTPMTHRTIQGIMDYRHLDEVDASMYWASTLLADRFLSAADVAHKIISCLWATPNESGQKINLGGGVR